MFVTFPQSDHYEGEILCKVNFGIITRRIRAKENFGIITRRNFCRIKREHNNEGIESLLEAFEVN